jgi:cell division protein ZapA
MPQVAIQIGGRTFEVACQPGEEAFLQSAAQMLDNEASPLIAQVGRMPESQMLLMAGLLLADKSIAMEERLKAAEEAAQVEPTRVEVPVIPPQLAETMAELAARAEALADEVDQKAKG